MLKVQANTIKTEKMRRNRLTLRPKIYLIRLVPSSLAIKNSASLNQSDKLDRINKQMLR